MVFVAFAADMAWADSGDDNLRLLREQQRQLDELRRQEQARPSGGALPDMTGTKPDVVLAPDACLSVSELRWQGDAPLDTSARIALAKQYSHRCLGEHELNELLRAANRELLHRGYITSRVLLREDAFQDGVLTLTLLTGRVARIEAEGVAPAEVRAAMPYISDGAFNLRDLEQGLDQLNRLASNHVQAELRPGEQLGESDLALGNQSTRRWQGFAGLDNGGSPSTGRLVGNIGLSRDNLIGSGDFWSVAYRRSFSGTPGALTQGGSLYASQPWGYWTGSFSLFLSESEVLVRLTTQTLQSRTTTVFPTLRLDRVLQRDATGIWSAQLALSRRATRSLLDGELLDVSSPTNSVAELDLQFEGLAPWPWGFRLSRSQGLTWFGADRDNAATVGLPRAQFEKWRLDLHTAYAAGYWLYQAEGSAQYSPDRLPGAEEMALGDAGSVRGFQAEPVTAPRGGYLRQTLARQWSRVLQPYAGLDIGRGQTPEGWDWLGSLSLGLRVKARSQALDVSVSRDWRQLVSSPSPRLMLRYSVSF